MVRRPASAQTASAGVTQTRHAVETGMRWIFREQPFEDYGIDAHIEVVDDETVLGRLVALQIKAGRSYFDSPAAGGGWWFRDDAMHFKYWLDFSIPVVIVLVDLEDRLCYWQLVTESTVEKSNGSQWKLRVPETHLLDGSAVQPLRDAAVKGIRQARREPGAPVTTFAAADLEVHSALAGADVLPEYIVRAHDRELDELVANAMGSAARSACKVLIGGSCTGKTRALYEALHRRGTDPGRASLAEGRMAGMARGEPVTAQAVPGRVEARWAADDRVAQRGTALPARPWGRRPNRNRHRAAGTHCGRLPSASACAGHIVA
ncbi:DUF4365 domain-containing protein [Nocardia niwae]|uniref:DUF4365 domain-containing protein n=1 Tax=Nocardia niwae TaxID=626084 RepID=UPI00340AE5D6